MQCSIGLTGGRGFAQRIGLPALADPNRSQKYVVKRSALLSVDGQMKGAINVFFRK